MFDHDRDEVAWLRRRVRELESEVYGHRNAQLRVLDAIRNAPPSFALYELESPELAAWLQRVVSAIVPDHKPAGRLDALEELFNAGLLTAEQVKWLSSF
jgi:hypothetical protein